MKPDPWIVLIGASLVVLFIASGLLALSASPAPRLPIFNVSMGHAR